MPVDCAELCEEETFKNLKKLNDEVVKIYKPGLKIYICPGDARVQNVNKIPKEKTEKYVESLIEITNRYRGLFSVIPISILYNKYSIEFSTQLRKVSQQITGDICKQLDFEKLVSNARKNIFINSSEQKAKIAERSIESAKDYIIYRVAEEEAQIFREFDDYIRAFFSRHTSFYKRYIKDISKTKPRLDCLLVFYTGRKGNIIQPWQAVWKNGTFASQEKLKKMR